MTNDSCHIQSLNLLFFRVRGQSFTPQKQTRRKSNFWSLSQNCEKWLLASSCLSVCPQGTTWLPLYEFSWNVEFEYFSNICYEKDSLKWNKYDRYFTWRPMYVFDLSRSVLLRIRKVLDKRYREIKTRFIFNNFFFWKFWNFWDNVETYYRAGQATNDSMEHAHWILNT